MEYKIDENFKIINDNSKLMLKYLKENSIDSIVCDPPYGLTSITKRFGKENSAPAKPGKDGSFARLSKGFMGKTWDGTGIEYDVEFWEQCYKVLKPGGYLLAFGGTRTYHRMACAIEDAGFEIRDTLMWLYGSGFPKSHNVGKQMEAKILFNDASGRSQKKLKGEKVKANMWLHHLSYEQGAENKDYSKLATEKVIDVEYTTEEGKQWEGYGTSLKPAYEPIIMARKPLEGSVANNILKYGVGAINIDECRVGDEEMGGGTMQDLKEVGKITGHKMTFGQEGTENCVRKENPNISIGRFPANVITDGSEEVSKNMYDWELEQNACRYFYCAKASKKDRDEGLDAFEEKQATDGCIRSNNESARKFGANSALRKNIHPTVKPTELMQYLVRLVSPKGATILDPFNGSGSTGKAVAFENRERQANYKYIGFELEKEYVDISIARINFALHQYEYEKKQEEIKTGQMSLF